MKQLLTAVAALFSLSAMAQTTVFSHYTGSGELNMVGTQKTETYDVAMLVSDPALVGTKIEGVRIYIAENGTTTDGTTSKMTDASVFLTSSLELKVRGTTKVNDPNILSQPFEAQGEQWNEVRFETPYEITADGVYVGYSFTINESTGKSARPVATVRGVLENSLFLHTSRTYRKWSSYTNSYGSRLAMEVLISGVAEQAAAIDLGGATNVLTGDEAALFPATIRNNGATAISNIEYACSLNDGEAQKHTLTFPTPIPARFNAAASINIPIPPVAEKGSYNFNVQVTKVNGVDVVSPLSTGTLNVYKTMPKHRAVVEEYTGTWCGYCPRGMVGLKKMNQLYPEDFVGISYHNDDPMCITYSYPSSVQGFPDAWLDRVRQTDAFLGDGSAYPGPFGLDKVWLKRCEEFAPASVDVESTLANGTINIKSYVTFPVDADASGYKLAYAVLHDGMTGKSANWLQSNYYGGSAFDDPDMQPFVNGGSSMAVTFDDVIVFTSGNKGIEGSLPAQAVADVPVEHTYSIPLTKVVNVSGESLVQDTEKMRVVVLLLDAKTGVIVNAHKARLGESTRTGITSLKESGSRRADTYDLSGRRVKDATKGVYIIGGQKVLVK